MFTECGVWTVKTTVPKILCATRFVGRLPFCFKVTRSGCFWWATTVATQEKKNLSC